MQRSKRRKEKKPSNLKMKTSPPKYGDLLLQLERVLEQMIDYHEVQRYDVLGAVDYWVRVHRPDAVEEYLDGSIPDLFRTPG